MSESAASHNNEPKAEPHEQEVPAESKGMNGIRAQLLAPPQGDQQT